MRVAQDKKALWQVIKTAQNIICTHLPTISDNVETGFLCKGQRILNYRNHLSYSLLTLLPSGKT